MSKIKSVVNKRSRVMSIDADLINNFDKSVSERVLRYHESYPEYSKTPLEKLKSFSKKLGLKDVLVKDESKRFGLKAFKVLGGLIAIGNVLAEKCGIDFEKVDFQYLQTSELKKKIGDIVFCTASDGNHGRGMAYSANRLGFNAVVYLPAGTVPSRINAIAETGAEVIVTETDYDQTVIIAREESAKNGWELIQDTSWEGYHQIPLWIMQGYLTLVHEIFEQMSKIGKPTHVFLQAGVGSMAAAVIGAMVNQYGLDYPKIIIVEPLEAACFYESIINGGDSPKPAIGNLKTIMAGLSCGVPSDLAYDIISNFSDVFLACDDSFTVKGMKLLANPNGDDPVIISGESGAVGTGLLSDIMLDDKFIGLRNELQLNLESSALLLNTEGDTDPINYKNIVGTI